ncbi:hypothetical protein V6N13_136622 [Hibiscus sabdariffa]
MYKVPVKLVLFSEKYAIQSTVASSDSIMLHCINLKIMSHLPCFLRSINEFKRKRKRFNISSKSSKLLDEPVSHSHGISHTLCPCRRLLKMTASVKKIADKRFNISCTYPCQIPIRNSYLTMFAL